MTNTRLTRWASCCRAVAACMGMVLAAPFAHAEELALSLADAVTIAQERSFNTARAQRQVRDAQSRYQVAQAALRPRFDSSILASQAGTSFSHDHSGGLQPQFLSTLGLTVQKPVDIGGVIGRQIDQADLQRGVSDQNLQQSGMDVLLVVQNAYYEALRAQETVRIDAGVVSGLIALVDTLRQRNAPSLGFVDVELANAKQTLTNSSTTLDLTLDNLKQILRLDPSYDVVLTDQLSYMPLPAERKLTPEQAVAVALAHRPEVRQAHIRIEQARVSLASSEDTRKPTLNLQMFSNTSLTGPNPGQALDNPSQFGHGVSATLTIPLLYFDWGVLDETKRQALIALEQAEADLQELNEFIGLEVRQSLISFTRAEQRITSLPDRAQALQALDLAEAGLLTDPDAVAQVSVARANLRQAETAAVDALADYNLALFRLGRALGERDAAR